MSSAELMVISEIVTDYFGCTVSKVAVCLAKEVSAALRDILRLTGLKLPQVRTALSVLYQHNLVHYVVYVKNTPVDLEKRFDYEYELDIGRTLLLLRYPLYRHLLHTTYGKYGEVILQTLLRYGQQSSSDCIRKSFNILINMKDVDLEDINIYDIKKVFATLVEHRLLERCPTYAGECSEFRDNLPCLSSDEEVGGDKKKSVVDTEDEMTAKYKPNRLKYWHNRFNPPPMVDIGLGPEPFSKFGKREQCQVKKTVKEVPDKDIRWRYNPYRFHDLYRNNIVKELFKSRHGEKAAQVIGILMRSSVPERPNANKLQSTPVSMEKIKAEIFKSTIHQKRSRRLTDADDDESGSVQELAPSELADFLDVMTFNSNGIMVCSERSLGGKYAINIVKAIRCACKQLMQNMVNVRFGSQACRVFGALIDHEYLDQDQLNQMMMFGHPKETKYNTYELFEHGFIDVVELSKDKAEYSTSRCSYLMCINMPLLCRTLIVELYQSISNAFSKKKSIISDKKHVLDKAEHVERILNEVDHSANGEDTEEIQEQIDSVMPAFERVTLNKAKTDLNGFTQIILDSDEMILKLQLMMRYGVKLQNRSVVKPKS